MKALESVGTPERMEKLEPSGAEFRAMVENAQDIITVLAGDGSIRYESPSIERFLGYAPDEMIGTYAFDYMHPDDLPAVLEMFMRGIQEPGFTATTEYRFRHKDGSWRVLESSAKNLLDDPVVAGVVVNSRDVTERRAAERALRRSEARNRALLDALPDAMVRLSRDGTYLDVKLPSDYKAFVDPQELIGTAAFEVLPREVAERAMACLDAVLKTGETQSFEYEIDVGGERRVREARVVASGDDEVISIQRDITERKRAEESVIESEKRFRDLFESSPDAIFVEDFGGTVLDANPAACRLHGLSREELVGRNVRDLVPPEAREEALREFERLSAGEIEYAEGFSQSPAGQPIPVEIRASRFVFGRKPAVLLHVRDITERKEAESEIKRLKAFYEQVLDDLPADVAVMDPEGHILYLNKSSVADPEMRDWLIGKTAVDYCRRRGLDETLARRRQKNVRQAIEERQMRQFEEAVPTREGGIRYMLRLASPVIDPDGQVRQVIGYGLDITERKQAEEALLKSEALLRTVVANVPVILFAFDREGIVTLAEGKGLEALNSKPGEVVGLSVFDLYRRLPAFQADLRRALAGEAFSTLVEVSGRIYECWLSPLEEAGGVASVIGVAADVTELKRSEEALRHSREQLRNLAIHLQSVREQERTRIAREVHDVLGQALTAMRMDVSWVEKELDEEQAKLRARLDAMKGLIDSTIQTVRRIASDLRPGVLDDLGLEAALEWQSQDFEARTDIVCSFTDRAAGLDLDRDRATAVFRIFQEILTNVARHAEAAHVDILLDADAERLLLRVADDGRGIREEDLQNTKSLGVLGMRERVLPWGGRVHFSGSPGQGTTVTVVVPLAS